MVAGAVTTGMLARNSKIMATATGSLTTMFGAFIDIFLMPFIPLIIPVLKYIASLIPKWMEWTQKFADLFTKNPLAALKWAAEEFLKNGKELGYHIGEMFGISTEKMDLFYKTIGEWNTKVWSAIQTAWTTSIDYIKGVWEESGGSVWESIKTMAGDAWVAAKNAAEAAWDAFVAWQPGVVSTITGAWGSAASYVSGVWEEGGCTVMGSIGVVGKRAMSAIGSAGKWAWSQFAAWQPGVAANIERVWCIAADFVTNTWASGGKNIIEFFAQVAGDVGTAIMTGLKWLWEESGFKVQLYKFMDVLQNWIYSKTGLLGPSPKRTYEDSGKFSGIGPSLPLSHIGKEFGNLNLMQNKAGGSAPPPNWLIRMGGAGGISGKDWWEDQGRSIGRFKVPFTNIGTDFFNADASLKRNMYETFMEKESLPMHAQTLEKQGHGIGEIQEFMQRRIRESYSERFSIVEMYKQNGKWKFDIDLNNSFNPTDTIDGISIS
jgi:hypothetical protein